MLTDKQKTDTRRWMGYGLVGDPSTAKYSQPVYAPSYIRTGVGLLLDDRLNHLTIDEEAVLINTYLTNLETLEKNILLRSNNVDTNEVGLVKNNPRELQDRRALYNGWRRDLCGFLNFLPGPYLGDGSIQLMRA